MATGSGLDAQFGFASESVVGTAVTPSKFVEFISEDIKESPTWLEPTALRVGRKYKRAGRVVKSRTTIEGSLTFEVSSRGIGLLVARMLGSAATPVQIASTSAYKQIHVPGDHRGKSLTVQVGRPEPGTGTVVPFTYRGMKIKSWEFSVSDGEVAQLKIDFDGMAGTNATALASASFVSAEVFNFSQTTLKLGGTPATASGELAVTGGTAVATVIKKIAIKGETPMATERFGLGSAGIKAEPLENGTPSITGTLDAEFSKVELYDVYQAGTTTALQLTMTGSAIPSGGGATDLFDIILPACKLKEAAPTVDGADIVQMSTGIEAYDNEADAPIQIKIVSADTAL